jgi:hypothetical protein
VLSCRAAVSCLPDAQVAQLVEQRTENPRVGGSIPSLGTKTAKPRIGNWEFGIKNLELVLVNIYHSQFSILNSQFSILNSQFSILNSQFSILNSQFSILNSQFPIQPRSQLISTIPIDIAPPRDKLPLAANHGGGLSA